MKMKHLLVILMALALTMGMVGASMAGTLDEIVKRGELRVAVQSGGTVRVCGQKW